MKNFLITFAVAVLFVTSASATNLNKADSVALFGQSNIKTMALNNNEMISTEGEGFAISLFLGMIEFGFGGAPTSSEEKGIYIDLFIAKFAMSPFTDK